MNRKSKLAAIAIAAAASMAMPALALAQLQTGTAANREQLYGYGASPGQFAPYYGRQAGEGAYAQVPGSALLNQARPSGNLRRLHRGY